MAKWNKIFDHHLRFLQFFLGLVLCYSKNTSIWLPFVFLYLFILFIISIVSTLLFHISVMLNPGPAGSQSARRFGSTQKTEVWVGPEWTEITGKPGPPAGPSPKPVQPFFFPCDTAFLKKKKTRSPLSRRRLLHRRRWWPRRRRRWWKRRRRRAGWWSRRQSLTMPTTTRPEKADDNDAARRSE